MIEHRIETAYTKPKNFCYQGVSLKISKEDFIEWFMKNDFDGCSVDRIDSNGDYEIGNIQLIPLADNIRKDKIKAIDGKSECFSCYQVKPLEEFTRDNRRPNGRSTLCLECDRIRWHKRKGVNESVDSESTKTDVESVA